MKINRNSWHYKYYSFFKNYERLFFTDFGHYEENPICHFILFYKITWLNNLINLIKLENFNFAYHRNMRILLKAFLFRFTIYQLWGSILIIIIGRIFHMFGWLPFLNVPGVTISKILSLFTIGILPIVLVIIIFTLIGFLIYQFFKIFIISLKQLKTNPANPPKLLIFYPFYLLIAPPYIIFLFIIQFFLNFIITLFYQVFLGTILFFEVFWLFLNIIFNFLFLIAVSIHQILKFVFKLITPIMEPIIKIFSAKLE